LLKVHHFVLTKSLSLLAAIPIALEIGNLWWATRLNDLFEDVLWFWCGEVGLTAVTTDCDEVELTCIVTPFQTQGHGWDFIVWKREQFARFHPNEQRAARGDPCFARILNHAVSLFSLSRFFTHCYQEILYTLGGVRDELGW
jgi:hypothetical protein